jgi:hypothetical protein
MLSEKEYVQCEMKKEEISKVAFLIYRGARGGSMGSPSIGCAWGCALE